MQLSGLAIDKVYAKELQGLTQREKQNRRKKLPKVVDRSWNGIIFPVIYLRKHIVIENVQLHEEDVSAFSLTSGEVIGKVLLQLNSVKI